MQRFTQLIMRLHLVVLGALASVPLVAQDMDRRFSVELRPLLAAKCGPCHGQNGVKLAALDLSTREAMLAGGSSGKAALVPGDAAQSPLYTATTWANEKLQMPPKENDRLTEAQTWLLRDWIDAGAPWPDDATQAKYVAESLERTETAEGIRVRTSGGTSEDWTNRRYKPEDLWAYQPVRDVEPPAPGHPVDTFHRAKLRDAGLAPAASADKLTLVRRAYFDLLGLPPTPQQTKEFLDDSSADAWPRLIDGLLASPHYGERWAQHWLDVARYADTAGNSNDYERSNAWRYRDYVIRSFNDDKPYDRFVMEQLAGDEINDEDPELLIATGFLRMGPWGSAMVPKRIARQAYLDDVVNSVGQAFLATPLRCAKCHDHKFDPIPTRDYYRFYAAFAGTQMAERPAAFLEDENQNRFKAERAHVQELKDFATEHKEVLTDKMDAAEREWYSVRGLEFVPADERKDIPDDQKPPRHHGLTEEEQGRLKVRQQDEWIWNRRLERYQPMAQSVFNGPDYIPGNGRKLRIPKKNDPSWRPENTILSGGNIDATTDPVSPGVLSVVYRPETTEEDPWGITDALRGRRLAVARWIAHPENPLSTRVIVNRIWQYHFGRGLATNANNVGVSGAKPTHPELLDYLTKDFVANGWKIKRLHKLIMTSKAYQQSAERDDMGAVREADPNNDLLAYFAPRRMTAEELRDAMLAVSGELNPEMGGVPIMPEINMEVALQPRMIQFSIAPAHQPSRTPAERNRRSVYAYRVRGQADPFLELFNQPNPNDSCERRDAPSVSPQALTLMNSAQATDRSIAFARRVEREAETLEAQVEWAVELALGRRPAAERREKLVAFVEEMRAYHGEHTPEPKTYPTQVTRSLVEEFTGKPFTYVEKLNRFEDYVPDTKPWEVSAETRALADLCILLFNSNEFVYVY